MIREKQNPNEVRDYLTQRMAIDRCAAELGLTDLQTRIVMYLGANNYTSRDESVPVSDIVSFFSVPQATISMSLSDLRRRKKFLEKYLDRKDERIHRVNLSPEGEKVYQRLETFLE